MKVLIIDDSPLTRTVLRDYLNEAGFEVYEAGSSFEAGEVFGRVHPELIIKDLYMADWDAIESIKYFKELDSGTKVVICSTDSYKGQIIEGLKAGAEDFLLKPINKDQVLATIKRLTLT